MSGKKGVQAVRITEVDKINTTERAPAPKVKKGGYEPGRGKATVISEQQIRYCEEFVIDFCKSKAAVRAGYSEKNPGDASNKLHKNPLVLAYIDTLLESRRQENEQLHHRITEELKAIAFGDITDFMEIVDATGPKGDANGIKFKPTDMWEKRRGKMVKSMRVGRKGVELTLYDKNDALKQLAMHIGYYKEDNDQKKDQGVQIYIPDNGRDTPPIK